MDFLNIKKSLFGFSKQSVIEYMSALSEEFNTRMEELKTEKEAIKLEYERIAAENEDHRIENESLLREAKALKIELDKANGNLSSLQVQVDAINKEKFDLVEIMVEARKYADSLKAKAEEAYQNETDKNNALLAAQKQKIDHIDSNINCVRDEIKRCLNTILSTLDTNRDKLHSQHTKISEDL